MTIKLDPSRFIAESYFGFQNDHWQNQGIGTSRKLFSKNPHRPTRATLKAFCIGAESRNNFENNSDETDKLCILHKRMADFLLPQWIRQLQAGINLALYGYGSKTLLIDEMISRLIDDGGFHVFCLRAYKEEYSAGITRMAKLLQAILLWIRELSSPEDSYDEIGKHPIELAHQIVCALPHTMPMVVVVEMADAPILRSSETWQALGILAESISLRLVITLEHHNSPHLIFGAENSLAFAWHNATTMRPYQKELQTLDMSFGRGAGGIDDETRNQGAKFVLASLTRTARAVFRVLAEHQLKKKQGPKDKEESSDYGDDDADDNNDNHDNEENSMDEDGKADGDRGMSFVKWYQQCQDAFLLSNELAFRTQLTEFIDHELVRSYDELGQNGNEFYIPFESEQIKQLLACQSEQQQ